MNCTQNWVWKCGLSKSNNSHIFNKENIHIRLLNGGNREFLMVELKLCLQCGKRGINRYHCNDGLVIREYGKIIKYLKHNYYEIESLWFNENYTGWI